MSDLVPAEDIERIVGVERHAILHFGRAVSDDQRVYILHSKQCLKQTPDLRDCTFSMALDRGIDPDEWVEDEPVPLTIEDDGRLVPMRVSHLMAPAEQGHFTGGLAHGVDAPNLHADDDPSKVEDRFWKRVAEYARHDHHDDVTGQPGAIEDDCDHLWCESCAAENGEREAMVSTLASLVAFAYLVDVEFEPDWMDATRNILGSVGWEVDPQDWRNWDWSEGATAATGEIVNLMTEVTRLREAIERHRLAITSYVGADQHDENLWAVLRVQEQATEAEPATPSDG